MSAAPTWATTLALSLSVVVTIGPFARPSIAEAHPAPLQAPPPVAPTGAPASEFDSSMGTTSAPSEILVFGATVHSGAHSASSPSTVEFRRLPSEFCHIAGTYFTSTGVAGSGGEGCREFSTRCLEGQRYQQALFRRESPTDPWVMVEQAGCTIDLATAVAQELTRLPLSGSTITIQPPGGNTLVNLDTIVYTDGATQDLSTTVLGTPLTIHVTPISYSWDFGDAAPPLVTTQTGAPYPHQTLTRPYTKPGTYAITLTTTWSARYQPTGTTDWLPVTGTATTTTTAPPLTAYQAHTHLVTDPLH